MIVKKQYVSCVLHLLHLNGILKNNQNSRLTPRPSCGLKLRVQIRHFMFVNALINGLKTVKITGVLPLANIDIIRKCFSIHHKNLLIICVNHGRLVYIVHHGRLMYIMELRLRIKLFTSGGSSHIIKLEPKIQIESATDCSLQSFLHLVL